MVLAFLKSVNKRNNGGWGLNPACRYYFTCQLLLRHAHINLRIVIGKLIISGEMYRSGEIL